MYFLYSMCMQSGYYTKVMYQTTIFIMYLNEIVGACEGTCSALYRLLAKLTLVYGAFSEVIKCVLLC